MIEKYYNFDVDRFLIDHDENLRKWSELKAEKEAAADSGGMNYGNVRGTGISDPTAQRAQRRERIDWEIREYEEYFKAHDRLLKGLTEEEMTLVMYLATPKGLRDFGELQYSLGYARQATANRLNDLRRKLRERADFGG